MENKRFMWVKKDIVFLSGENKKRALLTLNKIMQSKLGTSNNSQLPKKKESE